LKRKSNESGDSLIVVDHIKNDQKFESMEIALGGFSTLELFSTIQDY
jgi:hypothetical protein